jgi:hypothetical protein
MQFFMENLKMKRKKDKNASFPHRRSVKTIYGQSKLLYQF